MTITIPISVLYIGGFWIILFLGIFLGWWLRGVHYNTERRNKLFRDVPL